MNGIERNGMDTRFEISKEAGSLGAIITGIDLRDEVDDTLLDQLHSASLEHLVICIRGQQELTPDQQIEFARRWGVIEPHPYVDPIEGYPEMIRIYDPNPLTETWHTDFSYAKDPPALSFLLARTVPLYGGDTLFSSSYRVFEDLSEGLKTTLRGLSALHEGTALALSKGLAIDDIRSVHPIVAVHPETGRELLNVNSCYVKNIDGWTVEEGAPLLAYLYSLFEHVEYTYRHRWHNGDLLIWDNRCLQHRVVGDTDGQKRDLHRVTVAVEA
jgi:taurine dioxygenase